MKLFFSGYARFLKKHAVWVVIAFVLLLPLVGIGALRAIKSNSNDVTRWLPDQYPETLSLREYQRQFEMGSDAGVVIVWPESQLKYLDPDSLDLTVDLDKPSDPEDHPTDEELVKQVAHPSVAKLAEHLRAARLDPDVPDSVPLFSSVVTGPETLVALTRVQDDRNQEGVGLTVPEALHRLEGSLIGPDYIHGLLFDRIHPKPARIAKVEFDTPAEEAGLEAGQVVTSINGVATPDRAAARAALAETYKNGDSGTLNIELANGETKQLRWSGPRPGRQTTVIATLSESASGQKHLEKTLQRIRTIAEEDAGIDVGELRLGGPPVDNVAIDVEGRRTLVRLAILSFGVGLVMCWICLGRLKLMALVFFTAVFSEGTSLALVYWTGGAVDAILMTMPSLIYVLTISGAIHIVNYYRDSIADVGLDDAPAKSFEKGFLPCTIAAGTTAVGLASLYISDLLPIRNFGVYSALAVMTSLLWIFFFIPAVLQLTPLREKEKKSREKKSQAKRTPAPGVAEGLPVAPAQPSLGVLAPALGVARRAGTRALRHNLAITAVGVLLVAFFTIGITGLNVRVGDKRFEYPGLRTSVTLMKLFSDDSQIIHDYQWIESRLASLVPMEVIISAEDAALVSISGDPKRGQYRLTCVTLEEGDWKQNTTDWLEFNAEHDEVRKVLADAGLKKAVVETRGTSPNLTHKIMLEGGGFFAVLNAETRGELTENHVNVTKLGQMLDHVHLVDQACRRIEELHEVDTTLSTATFVPELPEERTTGWSNERSQLMRGLNAARGELKQGGFLAHENGRDLYRISLRIGAFADVAYSHFVRDIRRAVDPVVYAAVLEQNSGSEPKLGWQSTRQEIEERAGTAEYWYVHREESFNDPGEFVETNGYVKVASDGTVTAEIDGEEVFRGQKDDLSVRTTYTGIVPLVYKAQNELLRGLFKSYGLAFVLIAGVMTVLLWGMAGGFKALPAGMLVMLPNFFPTAIVFGGMAWMGVLVDIGTMMTASVALGVAVDDTVHFLTWYRRGIQNGLSRKDAAWYSYSHCALAMTQTTIVCAVGMASFALSTFQPTMRFGVLMVPLMAAALVGDLILLPAMLASPIGRFFDRGGTKKRRRDGDDQSDGADADQGIAQIDELSESTPLSGPTSDIRTLGEPAKVKT